jgi:hypothetical protein
MRKFSAFLACGALLLMSVAWVEGQQEKKQGGGGGFGGMFGGGPTNPYTLLMRADVKKEIDATDEQMEKLPDEMMVAISKVLNEKQFKRFRQLDLQKKQNVAFKDASVQKELKMTDEQKKNILTIITDETKEIAELMPKGGGFGKGGGGGKGGGKETQEKIETVRKDAKEKIYTVLTKDQRKAWREMVGEEFKFTQQGFGGGGFGGKGKDAKKDAADK